MADGPSRALKQARINAVQQTPDSTVGTIKSRSANIDAAVDAAESGTPRPAPAKVKDTSDLSQGRSVMDQVKRFFGSDDNKPQD